MEDGERPGTLKSSGLFIVGPDIDVQEPGPGGPEAAVASAFTEKASTGIDRLDQVLEGGLPPSSLVAVAGAPGTGKTILALHMLARAIFEGSRGLYVTTTHAPLSKFLDQYRSLSFMNVTGAVDRLDFLDLRPQLQSSDLSELLNVVVRRIQEDDLRIVAIDSFRAISDHAESRSEMWRFLGEFCQQLIEMDCIGLLLGEYSFPRDLDLPEFAIADVVIHLEIERQVASDLRTLRVHKLRGGSYVPGRLAFTVTEQGIEFFN